VTTSRSGCGVLGRRGKKLKGVLAEARTCFEPGARPEAIMHPLESPSFKHDEGGREGKDLKEGRKRTGPDIKLEQTADRKGSDVIQAKSHVDFKEGETGRESDGVRYGVLVERESSEPHKRPED